MLSELVVTVLSLVVASLVLELSLVAVVEAVSVASELLVSVLSELAVVLVASPNVLVFSLLVVAAAATAVSAGVVVSAETVPPVVSMNDTPIKADAKPKLYFLKPKRCFCSSLCS